VQKEDMWNGQGNWLIIWYNLNMSQSFRYCPNCGTQNQKEAKECIRCGLVFEKFKPFEITIQKEKEKKSYFLFILIGIIGFAFLSYMFLVINIEKKYLNTSEKKSGIYSMTLRLEFIYKRIPVENPQQKNKYLKEIDSMEKLVSGFPVSEDVEKLNLFEENLRDVKNILLKNEEADLDLKKKIEERFGKLK